MARWKPDEYQKALDQALKDCDYDLCDDLCNKLVKHTQSSVEPYEIRDAKKVLSSLRKKRYFDLMSRCADAFLRSGLTAAQIRRQYAQSLLDQGEITAALSILHALLAEQDVSRRERAEARGLVGRAYKQIYVDASDNRPRQNKEALRKATEAYHDVYAEDPSQYFWHGINAVALLSRAYRDGVTVDDELDPQEIAGEILDTLSEDEARDASMWDLATLSESCVALGKWEEAAKYLQRYVKRDSDAFEIASTLRQFEEVWQLDEEEGEERALTDLLRSELLKRSGGEVKATPQNVAKFINKANESGEGLEKVLGAASYQSYQWLLQAMQNARCVGRVWQGGRGVGTGFLLPGEAFSDDWEGQQVFVTNNHVISDPKNGYAFQPKQVRITFDVLEGGVKQKKYKVDDLLWQSAIPEFDTTIVRLKDEVEGIEDFVIASDQPIKKNEDRIYVIGHPLGGELSFSFQDNTLIDFNDRRIHYRSPTEPGSSGSPIFNDAWELIGLHHAGSNHMPKLNGDGTHPANEGIPFPAIKDAIENG